MRSLRTAAACAILLATAVSACQSGEARSPVADAGAEQRHVPIVLRSTASIAGNVTLTLHHAQPNLRVAVYASASTHRQAGPCSPPHGCLDLAPAAVLLGRVVADGAGDAALTVPASRLPATASWIQAAQVTGRKSAVMRVSWADPPPNFLIVLADDVGTDRIGLYGDGTLPPSTPTIDALAADGIRFEHAWAAPVCSASRATIMTGRLPERTGMGWAIDLGVPDSSLAYDEITIAEMLNDAPIPYTSVAVGKWHLSNELADGGENALLQGFSQYAGTLNNIGIEGTDGLPQSYTDYQWYEDAVVSRQTEYNTTHEADRAIDMLPGLREPWFMWLAFNAPHSPYTVPPPALNFRGATPTSPVADRFDAMLEALDAELGRVLAAMDPAVRDRTWVIFLGDNGTPNPVLRPPFAGRSGKLSMYELGVRVPLIVTGPGIDEAGASVDDLVEAADLFNTVGALAHAPIPADRVIDGVSLVPLLEDPMFAGPVREVQASQEFQPIGPGPWTMHLRGIRDDSFKLITTLGAPDELYDLRTVRQETINLLAQPGPLSSDAAAAYADLHQRLVNDDLK